MQGTAVQNAWPPTTKGLIVPLISRKQLLSLVLFAALACDGGPSSLSTGNLSISVLGLPAGASAAVMVTGPDGYSQPVSAT